MLALAQYFPASDECFAYFNPAEPSTFTTALDNLEAFIEQEGPFDAILGYSHGAQLAASMLARANMKNQPDRPIKCAFFLSGGIPYTREQRGADGVSEIYYLDPNKNGTPVDLPTAHIWGENDTTHPGTSVVLSELCKPEWRAISIHGGGHEIPGASSREYLIGAVKVIRKTVDLAVNRQ